VRLDKHVLPVSTAGHAGRRATHRQQPTRPRAGTDSRRQVTVARRGTASPPVVRRRRQDADGRVLQDFDGGVGQSELADDAQLELMDDGCTVGAEQRVGTLHHLAVADLKLTLVHCLNHLPVRHCNRHTSPPL